MAYIYYIMQIQGTIVALKDTHTTTAFSVDTTCTHTGVNSLRILIESCEQDYSNCSNIACC